MKKTLLLYVLALSCFLQMPLSIVCHPQENSEREKYLIERLCCSKADDKESCEKAFSVNVESFLNTVKLPYTDAIIEQNEWNELKIDTIIQGWQKYTKTKFDVWGLKKLLRFAPKGSQNIIRLLVEDEECYAILTDLYDLIKDNEDSILFYWNYFDTLHYDSRNLYYTMFESWFPSLNSMLNKSVPALEISQALEVAKPCATFITSMGVGNAVIGFALSKILGQPFNWKKSILAGLQDPIRNNDLRPAVFKKVSDVDFSNRRKLFAYLSHASAGDGYVVSKAMVNRYALPWLKYKKVKNVLASAMAAGLQGSQIAWYDYRLFSLFRDSYKKLQFLHEVCKKLQHKLTGVASMVRGLRKVGELANIDPTLRECPIIKEIQSFLAKEHISKNLHELLALLESSTFNSEATVAFSRGRLLKAHLIMHEIKDEFIPLLQNIALLGAYRTLADLFKDHQDKRVKYCFVDFIESEKPFIQLKNAWVPLLSPDKVVGNDITLGQDGQAVNAVFTGPNGGGKTTSMITIACNVLLSKLGIAAADQACMCEFKKIRTSLTPLSDITQDLSAFMAEQKRVHEVRKDIKQCDGKILVLLDEPYKGTVEVESATRVRKFGQEVAGIPHCSLLIATHLEQPIHLEDDTSGIFTNYQMGYIEHPDGTFTRTFRLEGGPAVWWFHDAKKRSTFVDWLCTQENLD